MNEWGKIVAIKRKTAVLSIPKSDKCDKCKKCRPGRGEKEMTIEANNKIGAQIGDTVEMSNEGVSFFERIFIQFATPLTDGIIGAFIGFMLAEVFNQYANKLLWSLVFGFTFAAVSYFLSKKIHTEISHLKSNRLVISSIIHRKD